MDVPEFVEFDGTIYRLMGSRRYYLSQSSSNAGRKRAKGLHVAVWESHHGVPVPPGWHVHHADGDTLNNDPENLVALPPGEHLAIARPIKDMERHKAHLDRVRPLASQWHASEEGRRWHSENARKSWARRKGQGSHQHTCEGCGKTYDAWRADARFCTAVCRNRYVRHTTERTTVEQTCVICGALFTTRIPFHKDRIATTCSRSCRGKLKHARATAGLQPDR